VLRSIFRGAKGRPSGHAAQFEAVFDAMDRGEPLPVTLDSARSTLEFIAAIYASAFTGTRVARGDITPESPFYTSTEGNGAPWS
jgi:predicted dehydrogenase